jgi:nucleotide-binding universal stress UspA family protein
MSFKKILCPVDFSLGSQQAMLLAIRLANESDAELVLTHVWYMPPLAYAEDPPFPPDTIQAMIQDEERGLAAAEAEASRLGATRVTTKFLTGVPWDQIVEVLRGDAAFGLAVMGTQGRTGLDRVLLGSVTEKVIRHAPCPVLAVPARGLVSAFNHVLCPVDFSESSRQAVALAAELAAPRGAGITLLHVVEVPVTYSGEPRVEGFVEDLDKRSARLLEEWARDLRTKVSVPVATRSRIGNPGAQTLAVLDDDKTYDLVVMGSHGRTGLRRVLLGSVAEKVVRHAARPVLIARARST